MDAFEYAIFEAFVIMCLCLLIMATFLAYAMIQDSAYRGPPNGR